MQQLTFNTVFFFKGHIHLRTAIFIITNDRMSDTRQMSADLMGSACDQKNFQQCTVFSLCQRFIFRFNIIRLMSGFFCDGYLIGSLIFVQISMKSDLLSNFPCDNTEIVFVDGTITKAL